MKKRTTPRAVPERVMTDRASSSLAILARRVEAVSAAARAGDEAALRAELQALSAEAGLLASARALLPR